MIAGYEVPDILLIFTLLSTLNLLLGSISYKFYFIWLPTALFALGIRVAKRGKPDNYLVHLVKFWVRPKYLSAFQEPSGPENIVNWRSE